MNDKVFTKVCAKVMLEVSSLDDSREQISLQIAKLTINVSGENANKDEDEESCRATQAAKRKLKISAAH